MPPFGRSLGKVSSRGDNITPKERAEPLERIAHRGAKREFPENTLAAFDRAFERGADAIELDVHATEDGVVVVHHDPSTQAMPLAGRAIASCVWNDVRRVDFGSGIGIPRLIDVLAAAPSTARIYVEIKGIDIEHAVADVIRQTSAQCAVHSFNHEAITRLREIAPGIPRGILFDQSTTDVLHVMNATGARDVWPHWRLIDASLVSTIHGAGGRVIAWTVNEPHVAQRLIDIGVDGLCSDDVRLLPQKR